jgi:hypothetical protein
MPGTDQRDRSRILEEEVMTTSSTMAPMARTILVLSLILGGLVCDPRPSSGLEFVIHDDREMEIGPLDGRVILILTRDNDKEPRIQVAAGIDAVPIFGLDADGLAAGEPAFHRESWLRT